MGLISKLENAKKIIIYGAGNYAKVTVQWLKAEGFWINKVVTIAVTKVNESHSSALEDIPVICFDEVEEDRESSLVFLAVSAEKQGEIIENIKKRGYFDFYGMTEEDLYFMRQQIKKERNAKKLEGGVRDILAAINFNRAIEGSDWIKRKDFAPGNFAVENQYMYSIFKILDTGKFGSVLDIGMGQTSKLVSQYANYHPECMQVIIEESQEWATLFSNSLVMSENIEILIMKYVFVEKNKQPVRVFEGFSEKLKGKKFDFISIDAPLGGDMKEYSRIDILSILPECLNTSFVIMIDDVNRQGENNTVKDILKILENNNIKYCWNIRMGLDADFAIITSEDNRFLCTI